MAGRGCRGAGGVVDSMLRTEAIEKLLQMLHAALDIIERQAEILELHGVITTEYKERTQLMEDAMEWDGARITAQGGIEPRS